MTHTMTEGPDYIHGNKADLRFNTGYIYCTVLVRNVLYCSVLYINVIYCKIQGVYYFCFLCLCVCVCLSVCLSVCEFTKVGLVIQMPVKLSKIVISSLTFRVSKIRIIQI